ncbi:hypothetical protein FB562_1423 [Homoserinimonas aerilata]|uniref:Uncharacterized protein n=1 Tax=Homoserinimonas aerilata TaxID=1162970 RepID=A0A542YJS9_9MICO|nr:DUF4190 domain-containing protein [Homoserinimonas aerilata]TQL48329.1 hypothetical protein FB562_1423 [Homoserinimonas aerilata]
MEDQAPGAESGDLNQAPAGGELRRDRRALRESARRSGSLFGRSRDRGAAASESGQDSGAQEPTAQQPAAPEPATQQPPVFSQPFAAPVAPGSAFPEPSLPTVPPAAPAVPPDSAPTLSSLFEPSPFEPPVVDEPFAEPRQPDRFRSATEEFADFGLDFAEASEPPPAAPPTEVPPAPPASAGFFPPPPAVPEAAAFTARPAPHPDSAFPETAAFTEQESASSGQTFDEPIAAPGPAFFSEPTTEAGAVPRPQTSLPEVSDLGEAPAPDRAAPDWSALGRVTPENPFDDRDYVVPADESGSPLGSAPLPPGLQPDALGRFSSQEGAGARSHPRLGVIRPELPTPEPGLAVLDTVALVAAVLLPPIGVVLGFVASARGRIYRGWASGIARAAIAVGVVMTLVFAVAGAFLWAEEQKRADERAAAAEVAAAHDSVVQASAEFCAGLAGYPSIFAEGDPDFGWPSLEDPNGYLPAIANYSAVWQGLVPVAPEGISAQVQSFSTRVDGIVGLAQSLQTANRSGDVLGVHSSDDITSIAAYVGDYCE